MEPDFPFLSRWNSRTMPRVTTFTVTQKLYYTHSSSSQLSKSSDAIKRLENKPIDLDLHCLQMQGTEGASEQRLIVSYPIMVLNYRPLSSCKNCKHTLVLDHFLCSLVHFNGNQYHRSSAKKKISVGCTCTWGFSTCTINWFNFERAIVSYWQENVYVYFWGMKLLCECPSVCLKTWKKLCSHFQVTVNSEILGSILFSWIALNHIFVTLNSWQRCDLYQ